MDKILLTGINKYTGVPLDGCVNDVLNLAELMPREYHVSDENIRLLVDERATKWNIMERLKWLVDGAKAGDRLFFLFSGHGSQVSNRLSTGEVDQLSEIICPVDMQWDPDHYITDYELYNIFKHIPEGVKFGWMNDSCHSGGLTSLERDFHNPPVQKSKYLPPPEDILWRVRVAKGKNLITTREEKKLNVQFVSGCKSNQTSADTVIDGKPCGAMTYFFTKNLVKMKDRSFKDIVIKTVQDLRSNHYQQEPQAEGGLIAIPFWGDETLSATPVVEPTAVGNKPCKRRWYFPWTWCCKG